MEEVMENGGTEDQWKRELSWEKQVLALWLVVGTHAYFLRYWTL